MDVEVEQGYVKHAALAQLHRGYQIDKTPRQRWHRWHFADDPTQRFARIQAVKVEVPEPFRPQP